MRPASLTHPSMPRASSSRHAARLFVLAGPDGAGKSSVAGAAFRAHGGDYFDPDEAAVGLRSSLPMHRSAADALVWHEGRRLLARAVAEHLDHAFETTLGARTLPRMIAEAAASGIAVHVWYAALASPELHIRRVRSRVALGGHDVAEETIRRRYHHSRLNLIELLPWLAALRLYDNSVEADPSTGAAPRPRMLLRIDDGRIGGPADLASTPDWARPIVAAAMKASR